MCILNLLPLEGCLCAEASSSNKQAHMFFQFYLLPSEGLGTVYLSLHWLHSGQMGRRGGWAIKVIKWTLLDSLQGSRYFLHALFVCRPLNLASPSFLTHSAWLCRWKPQATIPNMWLGSVLTQCKIASHALELWFVYLSEWTVSSIEGSSRKQC